jgi:hypothetical protein
MSHKLTKSSQLTTATIQLLPWLSLPFPNDHIIQAMLGLGQVSSFRGPHFTKAVHDFEML